MAQPRSARSGARPTLPRARRVVIKIGSRTLASDAGVYERLAQAVASARSAGKHVVLVSSGAIALGVKRLGLRGRPKEMARLQAAAAAGQSALMQAYDAAFAPLGLTVAQVLLTHADLADRTRANNARAALAALLEAGAVPILNENDSVSVEEIKFGDNDQLAAMVAPLLDADLLVLLSDVEGLLDGDGKRIAIVRDVAQDALPHVRVGRAAGSPGTGGMTSKVEAARRGTLAGADVVLADARVPGVVDAVLRGEDVGTWFVASDKPLAARKYWIAFTLRSRGDVILDAGCTKAVREQGRSVLAVGVLGVRGTFRAGDAVRLLDPTGAEVGRGLAKKAAVDVLSMAGKSREELGTSSSDDAVVIHRDELVVEP